MRAANPQTTQGLTRAQLDVTDSSRIAKALADMRPSVVINAAAMAHVDACERDEALAFRVNADAPGRLAHACAENDCAFVHVSTDYVFGADATTRPRVESDAPAPVNMYGTSKLAGEARVAQTKARFCIVRTAWLFGYAGDFVDRMRTRARAGDNLRVTAQPGTPTPIAALADAILRVAERLATRQETPPLLHIAGAPPTTRFEWVREALLAAGLPEAADRMTLAAAGDFNDAAVRPAGTPLDTTLYQRLFGDRIAWRDALIPGVGAR